MQQQQQQNVRQPFPQTNQNPRMMLNPTPVSQSQPGNQTWQTPDPQQQSVSNPMMSTPQVSMQPGMGGMIVSQQNQGQVQISSPGVQMIPNPQQQPISQQNIRQPFIPQGSVNQINPGQGTFTAEF